MVIFIYIYIYIGRYCRDAGNYLSVLLYRKQNHHRSSRCPLAESTKNHRSCSPPMYYNYYDCCYFNLLQLSLSPRARPDVIIVYHCCRLQQYSSLVGNCRLHNIYVYCTLYNHIISTVYIYIYAMLLLCVWRE
jgi:hypothetical protein